MDEKKIIARAAKVNKKDRDSINYFVTLLTKQFIKNLESNKGLPLSTKTMMIDALKANLEMIQRNLK